jgi:hypothetical protein
VDKRELVSRLSREFGMGDCPMARLRCFNRLATLAEADSRVLAVVRASVVEAKLKRSPGRWFCRAVTARLVELSLVSVEPLPAGLADVLREFGSDKEGGIL